MQASWLFGKESRVLGKVHPGVVSASSTGSAGLREAYPFVPAVANAQLRCLQRSRNGLTYLESLDPYVESCMCLNVKGPVLKGLARSYIVGQVVVTLQLLREYVSRRCLHRDYVETRCVCFLGQS